MVHILCSVTITNRLVLKYYYMTKMPTVNACNSTKSYLQKIEKE